MSMISIVMPCYNEEENVTDAYEQVKEVFAALPDMTTSISLSTTPRRTGPLRS